MKSGAVWPGVEEEDPEPCSSHRHTKITATYRATAGASDGKESACNVGDMALIPGLGRSPGEGNGNPLQYSCLENPMGKGTWQATVHGVTKVSDTI